MTLKLEDCELLDIELPQEFKGLPVFAVGGAIRDTLLGKEVSDIDLMVAEVGEEEMLDRGFRKIDSPNNNTFGVFQDSLGREVAIAREEVSNGTGHNEFDVTPVPADVQARKAVQRDLKRRDFTINAIGLDLRHNVISDPHDGLRDLEDKVIRSVNENSFEEDPLRVLRGARFATTLDFDIKEKTEKEMTNSAPKLTELPGQRCRIELEKVLNRAEHPRTFFDILKEVGALEYAFPELHALTKIEAGPSEYHEEGSAFCHTMLTLEEMQKLRPNDEKALLMALSHDLGKGKTPVETLPHHYSHDERGVGVLDDMKDRLGLTREQYSLMKDSIELHTKLPLIDEMNDPTILDMWKRADDIDRLVDLATADARGRIPEQDWPKEVALEKFELAERACDEIKGRHLIAEGYHPGDMGGKEFGDLLKQRRVEQMRRWE